MTQGVRIVWKGEQAFKKIANTLSNRLRIIGSLMERDVKRSLSNPPPPSRPGEPPHRREGGLRQSITHEVVGDTLRVGTNIKYAKWLELGTSKMAARPFLRPALENARDDIKRMLKL